MLFDVKGDEIEKLNGTFVTRKSIIPYDGTWLISLGWDTDRPTGFVDEVIGKLYRPSLWKGFKCLVCWYER